MPSLALKTIRPLAVSPVLVAAGAVGFASTLDSADGTTFCFFRICTGGYCPGCGGSRAAAALIRGDLAGSWAIHPWVPLLAVQFLVALAALAVWGQERISQVAVPVLILNIALGLVLWGVRLSAGSIPTPF